MKLNKKKLGMEIKRQGLTYQTLGKRLGVSRQAVGYYFYESRNLNLSSMNRLAKVLGIDPKDLLI